MVQIITMLNFYIHLFRSYISLTLLGYKELSFSAKCEKVLLEQNEIAKGQYGIDHYNIQCDQCMCCYHCRR